MVLARSGVFRTDARHMGVVFVNRADVPRIKGGRVLSVSHKARAGLAVTGQLKRQHLDRHVPVEFRIPRAVDLAHAAFADLGGDVVMAESGADFECHRLLGLVRAHSIYGWAVAPAGARNCLLHAHERSVRGFLRLGGVKVDLSAIGA